jgi:hypothetical protein
MGDRSILGRQERRAVPTVKADEPATVRPVGAVGELVDHLQARYAAQLEEVQATGQRWAMVSLVAGLLVGATGGVLLADAVLPQERHVDGQCEVVP